MRTTILKAVLASVLAAAGAIASAAERAAYRDGDIEVLVFTSPLPTEFAGSADDADWQWFGTRTLVTRISVTVGKAHAVLPVRAYLGMSDPGAVAITRSRRKGRWRLTVTGSDGANAYRTVMEFVGPDVRLVKEYALEADDAHPFVVETFAPAQALD